MADANARAADSFAARLDAAFASVWPPRGASGLRSEAPSLEVRDADPGQMPACARRGDPVFWLYLAGLFRSFATLSADMRSFLDHSASCWFVVLFTPSLQDSSVTSWHHGDARTVTFQNGTLLVRDSMAPLRAATCESGRRVLRSGDTLARRPAPIARPRVNTSTGRVFRTWARARSSAAPSSRGTGWPRSQAM